ncbi:hypothetical protein L873DRAFT_1258125 [Choiromyces venosus 120613-1]|uniref:C2H2-type domain-containing protein n=1 Tax=Choiromyces venosus 120613-1 TaxID=1336337 RepID=A0A3N4JII8_9PEZI|nr:hypothetical protein L873DRAFT_1258125 [Choiromyces venosus 120613-1]
MALDNRQRHHPLHHGSFGGFQPPTLGSVQFTNPWTSASPQSHLIASSIPDVGGLGSLVKPDLRSSSVSASYQTIPTTAGIPTSNPSRNMSSPTLLPHHNDFMKNEMLGFGANSPFGGDISMSGSSAPSPTAVTSYSGVPSFAPTLDFSTHHSRTSYPLSNNDRRMSQPAMSNTMFLGSPVEPPRQRQNSLMEWTSSSRPLAQPPRSTDHHQFSDTLDSARGMVAMSQASRQPRGRVDGSHNFYPTHSTNSSISSTGSYNGYYGGGSVDSSTTDYSDSTGFTPEAPRPTLPRPGAGMHTVPVQGALMTTFSSKITSSTQKKHKCKVCDKRFTRPSSLQTHTYSHTGEKPFACEVDGCGRKFSVVSNLRRHKKVHNSKSS